MWQQFEVMPGGTKSLVDLPLLLPPSVLLGQFATMHDEAEIVGPPVLVQ
jgi:hypothetical protein